VYVNYRVSQKSSPLKLFCNIFTLSEYISVSYCQFIVTLYPHVFTNFGQFVLIFNFSRNTYRFDYLKFRVSTSEIASIMMSGSPNLNPLDYTACLGELLES